MDMTKDRIVCPRCNDDEEFEDLHLGDEETPEQWGPCRLCYGTGRVTLAEAFEYLAEGC